MDGWSIFGAFVVGIIASSYGAAVGGGALLTVPALIWLGVPVVEAVATSKLGSMGVSTAGLVAFGRAKMIDWRLGFAMVNPQRPGGAQIDPARTPMVARDPDVAAFMDGVAMQALFEKSGETWVAVHWAIGATDVWFSAPELCAAYRAVIADYCH